MLNLQRLFHGLNSGWQKNQVNFTDSGLRLQNNTNITSNIGCVLIYLQGGTTNEIRM